MAASTVTYFFVSLFFFLSLLFFLFLLDEILAPFPYMILSGFSNSSLTHIYTLKNTTLDTFTYDLESSALTVGHWDPQLYWLFYIFNLPKVRQATSRFSTVERQLTDRTSESSLHESKLKEIQEELESKARRIGELEGSVEAKDIELKESAALVDRVKALHGEQCLELQRQIEEVI